MPHEQIEDSYGGAVLFGSDGITVLRVTRSVEARVKRKEGTVEEKILMVCDSCGQVVTMLAKYMWSADRACENCGGTLQCEDEVRT